MKVSDGPVRWGVRPEEDDMSKTKVKYTNHKDRSKIGQVIEVDVGRAKQLIRDGLAVAAPANAQVKRTEPAKSEPVKADGDKGK